MTSWLSELEPSFSAVVPKPFVMRPEWNDHPGLAVGISCTAQAAQATENIFQHQGDKSLRINIPNAPIAVWVYACRVKDVTH
jgi:hypothetical protein